MITVEKDVLIECSPETVFAFVSDQTNGPRWQRGLTTVRRTTGGPIGIGTRHSFERTMMGRRMDGSNEYTRYEPNQLVAFAWSGPMPGQASYVVEQEGARATRLAARLEMRAHGILRVAQPLLAAALRRDMMANLVTLKHVLESEAGSSPSGWADRSPTRSDNGPQSTPRLPSRVLHDDRGAQTDGERDAAEPAPR